MEDFAPKMSRVTYFIDDEEKEEKEIIIDYNECKYKVNGKCYNNFGDYKRLGKRCYLGKDCTHFLCEQEEIND